MVSICAVVLLVLVSVNNVVGYRSVQSSNQNGVKNTINRRELLFQTIVDISNNIEIQRLILINHMKGGIVPIPHIPVVTKNQLKSMVLVGMLLSKSVSKAKVRTMVQQYSANNQMLEKQIAAVIEKDPALKAEGTQLADFGCDCEKDTAPQWNFPVLCLMLYPLAILIIFFYSFTPFFKLLYPIMYLVGATLNCFWFS